LVIHDYTAAKHCVAIVDTLTLRVNIFTTFRPTTILRGTTLQTTFLAPPDVDKQRFLALLVDNVFRVHYPVYIAWFLAPLVDNVLLAPPCRDKIFWHYTVDIVIFVHHSVETVFYVTTVRLTSI
jgi:hypothetical protein